MRKEIENKAKENLTKSLSMRMCHSSQSNKIYVERQFEMIMNLEAFIKKYQAKRKTHSLDQDQPIYC